MLQVSLKELFEEVKRRQISIDCNDGPQFYMFSKMKKLIDDDASGKVCKEQFEDNSFNDQQVQQIKMFDEYFTNNRPHKQIEVQKIKKQKNQSDTNSLSFIIDQKPQVKFMESLQWFELLGNNEKVFKSYMFNQHYAKTQKFDENNNFDKFSNLIIDKGKDTCVFSGLNVLDGSQIAIKETIAFTDYLEQAQQYILHAKIYELYPNVFLKIILPVYIYSLTYEKVRFTSHMELGEFNLFQYSQQHLISDQEYQLIYQQLYNQILLLHKHQIAHRDVKPQNIIFVKNKGWLLCDFGEAIQYQKQLSVYNIRGTFGFIPPKIYQASRIGDVLIQQDLFYNDLYGLGVTLLIIKHQIKKSSDIEQYIDKQDKIIQQLLQSSSLNLVDQLDLHQDIQFIEPRFQKKKQIDSSQFGNEVIIEYVNILNQVNIDFTRPFLQQIISTLDEFLERKRQSELVYLYVCQHIYFNSRYIKCFKFIPSLRNVRSIKFWRQIFPNKEPDIQQLIILFMHQLGFVDLALKYGFQYLNNTYCFTIHLIMIKILILLQENERVLNEYELLLKFRDQYYMNDDDLRSLIQISLLMLDYRYIDESELSYLSNRDFKALRLDIRAMDLNFDESDQVICQSFMHQCEIYQINTHDYWFDQSQTEIVKHQICEHFRLSLNDKLCDEINKQHKYSCTAFHYQNNLKISIINKLLLSTNKDFRKTRKQMNYLLIHHSESKHQYQINNLIKQSVIYYASISEKQKVKSNFKILRIIRAFKKLPYVFYKNIIIKELSAIIFQQLYNFDIRFLSIAILSRNIIIEYVIRHSEQIVMKQFLYFLLVIFKKSRNFRRVGQLDSYQEISLNSEQNKFQKLVLEGKIKKIRILRRQHKILQKEFLYDQYLIRQK